MTNPTYKQLREAMMSEYPNIEGLANGCVSGNLREWPLLPVEAEQIIADLDAAHKQIRRLEEEAVECDALRERMSDLLTRTANALKGEPAKLKMHSWHDLPEVAAALTAERDAAVGEIDTLRRVIEKLAPPRDGFGECFDDLIDDGIIVEVPADEAYREEWGDDTMYVYRWSDAALAAAAKVKGE